MRLAAPSEAARRELDDLSSALIRLAQTRPSAVAHGLLSLYANLMLVGSHSSDLRASQCSPPPSIATCAQIPVTSPQIGTKVALSKLSVLRYMERMLSQLSRKPPLAPLPAAVTPASVPSTSSSTARLDALDSLDTLDADELSTFVERQSRKWSSHRLSLRAAGFDLGAGAGPAAPSSMVPAMLEIGIVDSIFQEIVETRFKEQPYMTAELERQSNAVLMALSEAHFDFIYRKIEEYWPLASRGDQLRRSVAVVGEARPVEGLTGGGGPGTHST